MKRIPTPALVIAGALVGVLLILRARSRGSNVVQLGTATDPVTAGRVGSVYDPNAQATHSLSVEASQLAAQLGALEAIAGIAGAPAMYAGGSPNPDRTPLTSAPYDIRPMVINPATGLLSGPAPPQRVYAVQNGDTLASIAQSFYGNALSWPSLYNANRAELPNHYTVNPGQVLVIP